MGREGVPRPFNVSTITAVGSVSSRIDLAEFFAHLPITGEGNRGFTYVEHGDARRGTPSASCVANAKRKSKRDRTVLRKLHLNDDATGSAAEKDIVPAPRALPPSKGRYFDNQATVLYSAGLTGPDGPVGQKKGNVNVKVFRNGKVQITGLKAIETGVEVVELLVETLRSMPDSVTADKAALKAADYKVCLINSDFSLGAEIVRDRLFKRIRASYATKCVYEPCIYPGVKILFMWNDAPKSTAEGTCACSVPCLGASCRKITVAVFKSGKVLLTGAHVIEQLDAAYDFVKGLVEKHADEVVSTAPPPEPPRRRNGKAYLVGPSFF